MMMGLQVEAKMGFEGGEGDPEVSESGVPAISGGSAADLSFLNQPFEDAEGDWSFD